MKLTNTVKSVAAKGALYLSFSLLVFAACKSRKMGTSASTKTYPEVKLGWELGSQAYSFNRFTFAEAIAKIDSCNLRYVEAFPGQRIGGGLQGSMGPDMDNATRDAVLALLKAKNVKLVAFGVTGADNEAGWVKLFDFCKYMGVQTITAEPNEKDLTMLSRLADKYQINIAIHNHPKPSHYWNPDVLLNAIKGQSNRIGACADIGHWTRSFLDPVACLKKLDGHVLHLHMKDLDKEGEEGHDVHWGEGVSNTAGVIAELKRQHFKGALSAEYEYNWLTNSADIAASAVNFRKLVAESK